MSGTVDIGHPTLRAATLTIDEVTQSSIDENLHISHTHRHTFICIYGLQTLATPLPPANLTHTIRQKYRIGVCRPSALYVGIASVAMTTCRRRVDVGPIISSLPSSFLNAPLCTKYFTYKFLQYLFTGYYKLGPALN